jgi:23S rRNA (cytosine1962-C5)-methyltransferase
MKTDTNSLILKSGRDRSVNNFHPWIFSGAVKVLPEAANGDIISVHDNHGNQLGYGFFSPKSQIVCRIFEFTDKKLDFSAPDYWIRKVEDAFQLRKQIINFENTNTYRLLHAEGDFLPGIIADVYGDVLVLQLLIKGTEKVLPQLLTAFEKTGFTKIFLKNKENPHRFEEVSLKNGFLRGEAEGKIAVKENGLQFDVNFATGQKTGFFIDQRENRETVKNFSKGKRVLNAFSYTGGFSVYALAGGAKLVHSVDISKDASEAAKQNVVLNFGENAPHESIAADCFDYLRTMPENAYDIIVLDPPAFAKNAGSVPNASRGYKDLNMTAMQKAAPDSLLFTFSCSQNIDKDLFRKIIFSAAADAKRKVRILQMFSQSGDHPINIFHPESEYLKGLLLHIE